MKRYSGWIALAVLVVLLVTTISAFAAKGKEVTITGKLSCTYCTLSHPGQACPKGCCANCIKAGDPPLLVDGSGNMYMLTNGEKQVKLMTPDKIKLTGSKVVVKGVLVKGKGVQAIYVDSIKKAPK